jgi:hypothetical protein
MVLSVRLEAITLDPKTTIKLSESESAVFMPFHDFLEKKRAEQNAAERLLLEYILSNRKVTSNESIHAASTTDPEQPAGIHGPSDDASAGVRASSASSGSRSSASSGASSDATNAGSSGRPNGSAACSS